MYGKTELQDSAMLNELARIARYKFQDNAVEALIGILSTVTTPEQIEILCVNWARNDK